MPHLAADINQLQFKAIKGEHVTIITTFPLCLYVRNSRGEVAYISKFQIKPNTYEKRNQIQGA